MGKGARNHGGTRGHGYSDYPQGIPDNILFPSVFKQIGQKQHNKRIEMISQDEFEKRQILGGNYSRVQYGLVFNGFHTPQNLRQVSLVKPCCIHQ